MLCSKIHIPARKKNVQYLDQSQDYTNQVNAIVDNFLSLPDTHIQEWGLIIIPSKQTPDNFIN